MFQNFFLFRLFFCAVMFLTLASTTFASVESQIAVSWDYTGEVTNLAGFRLYQDGTHACEIADPESRQMICTVFLTEQLSFFTITAFDNQGYESNYSESFQVNLPPPIENVPPVAVMTTNVLEGIAPLAINFDGSQSNDPDGVVASYSWDFGDGSIAVGPLVDYTFFSAGNYTVMLTVTDDSGATAVALLTISVSDAPAEPVNTPPVAFISASVTEGMVPLQVDFDGTISSDTDGTITSYSWDFGDGNINAGSMVGHTFYTPGTYSVRLTVQDDRQATAEEIITIIVLEDESPVLNELPVAGFMASSLEGTAPVLIEFEASLSTDADGYLVDYSWDFGDGVIANGTNVQHIFQNAGQYSVTLVVTDNLGDTAQAQATAIIAKAPKGNKSSNEKTPGSKGKGRNKN